jgi:hypothetical protein
MHAEKSAFSAFLKSQNAVSPKIERYQPLRRVATGHPAGRGS